MFIVTSIYVISCLHLLYNIFTNLSPLWILLYKYFSSWEILRNYSTIFRSSHRRCSIKKAILKHFLIFTGKHLCRGLFFNKVAGHQVCNFIKKRLQHRDYLVNIGKFMRRPILKNGCIVGKCFVITFFRSDLNIAKGPIDDRCERLLKLVKIKQKCFLQ